MSAIKAGEAFIQASLRGGETVKKKLAQLAGKLASVAKVGATVMASGLATAGATLATIAVRAAKAGDQIEKMSARTDASAEFLSQMGFAMEQSGGSIEDMEKGMIRLSRTLLDASQGSKTASDGLSAIGITLAQLDGLSPEQQMLLIADGLKGIEETSKRGAVAQQLFGRGASQLLPLLSTGASGMKAYAAESDALGRTMSTEQVAAAASFVDALNRVKTIVKGLMFDLGSGLLPVLETILLDVQAAANVFGNVETSIDGTSKAGEGLGDTLAMLGSPIEFLVKAGAAIAGAFRLAQAAVSKAGQTLAKFIVLASKAGERIPGIGKFSKNVGNLAEFIAEDLERLGRGQAKQAKENFDIAFTNDFSERMQRERAKLKRTAEELPPMPIFNADDIEVPAIETVKQQVASAASGPKLSTIGSFGSEAIERLASVQKTDGEKTNKLLTDALRFLRKIAEEGRFAFH